MEEELTKSMKTAKGSLCWHLKFEITQILFHLDYTL
jgi:hypothetical protein